MDYVDLFNPPHDIPSKGRHQLFFGDADDVGVDVDVDAKSGGDHLDDVGGIYGGFTLFSGHTTSFAPSSSSCSACKYEECKNKDAQLISIGEDVKKSFDALTSVVKELISKRCVVPSRKIPEPFITLKIKRRKIEKETIFYI
ncbi:hypothetical protein MTR67_006972 [Solanum verrucosum]|uniref:Uncharacterized protein n=1 Tax=Solanum verrucosum TaxID=315347 RepID=A0AAF0PYZ3_SOLVR|nr:hypothetical protein MTR67_006972 [Solanum verrucosum]